MTVGKNRTENQNERGDANGKMRSNREKNQ